MAIDPSTQGKDKRVFVIQVANTKHPGGIETSVQHYARMLRENDIPSLCVYGGPAKDILVDEGVEVIDMPKYFASPLHGIFRTGHDLKSIVKARVKTGDRVVALVHSDRCLPAIKRLFSESIAITPCHSDKSDHKGRADLVITLNERQQGLVTENLGGGVKVLCLGNPYIPIGQQDAWSAREEDGEFRVLYASRFTPTKDPLVLIRALARLSEEGPTKARFIGSGLLEDEAKTLAKDLSVDAEFLGWQDDPWGQANWADCFVLPSHWEGLPFVLLEALSRAIPIVASDIAGNRAALADGKYGLLFKAGDDRHLADRILWAKKEKVSHRAMSKAGQNSVRDRFGAEAFGRKFMDAINSL